MKKDFFYLTSFHWTLLIQSKIFQGDHTDFMDNLLETQQTAGTQFSLSSIWVPAACSCHKRGLPLAVLSPRRLSPVSETSRNLNALWALELSLKIQQCTNGYTQGHQDHPNFHGQSSLSFSNNQAVPTARYLFGTHYSCLEKLSRWRPSSALSQSRLAISLISSILYL